MGKNNESPSQNGLDPDLAELLSIEETASPSDESPDFQALFRDERAEAAAAGQMDAIKKSFDQITRFEEDAKPFFDDKDFYKVVLAGEGENALKMHDVLGKFMKATDVDEKSKYRAQLITAYWDLSTGVSARVGKEMPIPKRLFLRFGILSPTFLGPEHREMISRIIFENSSGEPVWYLDEWLERIAGGLIRPSSTDEVKKVQKDAGRKLVDEVEKKKGQRETELTLLKTKVSQLEDRETILRDQVETLLRHDRREEYGGLKACFTPAQKVAASQIQEILRQLMTLDAQMASSFAELASMDKDLGSLSRKSEGVSLENVVDQRTVSGEFQSVRQMAKLCVGRKGNHFPIFLAQFVRPMLREIGTRENVISTMAQVEALDPGLFTRTYKQQNTRIVPNTLLLPSYGDTGICWEPFEKFNRATSRGRIAIPIFPKNLQIAVLTSMADLRWQTAKEKASYYWMEEGLTGKYYQWFAERKLKGDVREYFIRDYMIWITRESQGNQKLDKEIRGIFWRMLPFPQSVKDVLKNRGFVYNDLYKKDQNIARSDGY
jgi:hypothetical protein